MAALAAASEISVIGVTDYLGIENYLRVMRLHEEGNFPSLQLVVPNIEFRVLPATNKVPGANVHLLIDPSDRDHPAKIRQALSFLRFSYLGNDYGCSREHLIALGRASQGAALDDEAAYRRGVEQFRPDRDQFVQWLRNQEWLHKHSLIGVAAGGDGLSGWEWEGALHATREDLSRLSNFIFSGRPGEIEFWLLRAPEMDVDWAVKLGAPKPCLHGSDAHSLEKLFQPDLKRFCWIKGDPTFDGLRQVVFEPELRVHIGPLPPEPADPHRIIDCIEISDPHGWFATTRIEFNAGLVAVIGQKGSGKSALAELIAATCGAWKDEERAFLARAGRELNGLSVRLRWLTGEALDWEHAGAPGTAYPSARYLSQSFVEKLCAGEGSSSEELVEEIEAVIFESLPESERLGHGSFEELRRSRTLDPVDAAESARSKVSALIAEEAELRNSQRLLPEKEKRLEALKKEQRDLTSQLPKVEAGKPGQAVAKLQAVQQRAARLESDEAADKKALLTIRNLRARLKAFARDMQNFGEDVVKQALAAGIPALDTEVFRPVFPGSVEKPLAERAAFLEARIAGRRGGEGAAGTPGTLNALNLEIEALQKALAEDRALRLRLVQQTSRVSEIEKEVARLSAEVEGARSSQAQRLAALARERTEAYQSLWAAMGEERQVLSDLYRAVQIDRNVLEFSVDIAVDTDGWLERGLDLFDRRKGVPFGSIEALRQKCVSVFRAEWQSGDPVRALGVSEALLEELRGMARKGVLGLRASYSNRNLLEWVFSTEHLRLVYGLTHRGVELRKLSPGTKGIVLLMVYLSLDRRDSTPLVIDQPEENLDNESIYGHLVEYFREAKKRRQVILITHNPNLVVNTDADQVIIARNERQDDGRPLLSYESGSLEYSDPPDAGVREQVCRILEGGEAAFRKRERRYLLQ